MNTPPLRTPILIVSSEFPPIRGGVGQYAYELAREFQAQARSVCVLAAHQTQQDGEFDQSQSFPVVRMPEFKLLPLRQIARLWIILRTAARLNPSLILATEWRAGLWASLAARLYPAHFLVTAHGSEVLLADSSRWRRLLARLVYGQASRVMADSSYVCELLRRLGVPREHIAIVLLGTRPVAQRSTPEELLAFKQRRTLTDRLVLLTVARLVRRKGHDTVLRALPQIIESHPNVLYVVVGAGELRDEIEELAARLGIASHVLLAGNVADRERDLFVEACDLYLQPSLPAEQTVEGFGLSLAEAMAYGKTVIAGKHGGILDVIADGQNGILFEAGDPDILAKAVINVLQTPELACSLGANAARTISEKLNWTRVVSDIDAILAVQAH
jgi:phosphatidyl-myo-inositol dimannoside synthase